MLDATYDQFQERVVVPLRWYFGQLGQQFLIHDCMTRAGALTYTTLFAIQGIAHLNGSQSGAIQYAPVYIFINVMFAGYILYIPDVQDWLSFGPVISPMRYAFQALLRAEFVGNDELPESDDYIEIMGFDDLTTSGSIGILFIFFLITLFGSLAILWNVDHEQR